MPSLIAESRTMRHYFQDRSVNLAKRGRTRSALIDGAIATIAERGLAGASIKEITANVGLSNGTFYNHFKDRDDLIVHTAYAIAQVIADEIAEMVAEVDDGVGKIVLSTDAFVKRALEMPDWAKLIVSASRNFGEIRNDIGKHLRADVARAVEQGKLSEVPNRLLFEQIGALVALAIEVQVARGRDEQVGRQTCEAILRLLGMTPARAHRAVGSFLD
jgi:AcrR family transcriptional regulator